MPWVFGHEGGGDIVAVGTGVTDRQVGQLIYDHPVDLQATLAAVTAGQLTPEQVVQGTFPVEETAAALASVREIPGKSWIEFSSWRDGP
jgi:Alcohol dehydrogenase GroES-like domain